MHNTTSPLAGKTVKLKPGIKHPHIPEFEGSDFRVEDWQDRVFGKSWMFCDGNPACLIYAMRTGLAKIPVPTDDNVLYGKVGGQGCLVHLSEIEEG